MKNNIDLYRSDIRRLRNRKKRQYQLQRNISICVVTCVLVLILSITYGNIFAQARSGDMPAACKYYTSIEVHYGETLWSIAEDYLDTGHYHDIRTYINEILQINHLSEDAFITAGQYLIIPYYSTS